MMCHVGWIKSFNRPSNLCGLDKHHVAWIKTSAGPASPVELDESHVAWIKTSAGPAFSVGLEETHVDKTLSSPQCTLSCSTSPIVAEMTLKGVIPPQFTLPGVRRVPCHRDKILAYLKASAGAAFSVGLDECHVAWIKSLAGPDCI